MKAWDERRNLLPPRRRRAAPSGFTLIEIILVLAVVALLGTLLVPGVNSLLRRINEEDPDAIFRKAVGSAREHALTSNRTVWLRFESAKKRLVWADGVETRRFEVPPDFGVEFLAAREGGSMILLGGLLVDTDVVPVMRFYPDGTCDRVRVQFRKKGEKPQIIAIDPWTCAAILPPAEKR